jgi:hypothetical protein
MLKSHHAINHVNVELKINAPEASPVSIVRVIVVTDNDADLYTRLEISG